MIVNGVDLILISVKDMERSLSFFRNVLGLAEVARGPADQAWLRDLWGLGQGITAETAFLRQAEQTTLLELVEFDPAAGKHLREGAEVYDYGLFDIAFRTKDVDRSLDDLCRQGYRVISPPVVYTADWAKVTVKEAVFEGPDMLPLALIQRLTDQVPFEGDFSVMIDSAQFCDDMDRAVTFYTEILGFTAVFDRDLPEGLIDPVVQTPTGTRSRMAFLVKPGARTPAVELIGTDAACGYLDRSSGPPAYGLFGLAMEVEDLRQSLEAIQGAGYRIRSGPLRLNPAGLEKVRAALVEGPNRVILQLFEKA